MKAVVTVIIFLFGVNIGFTSAAHRTKVVKYKAAKVPKTFDGSPKSSKSTKKTKSPKSTKSVKSSPSSPSIDQAATRSPTKSPSSRPSTSPSTSKMPSTNPSSTAEPSTLPSESTRPSSSIIPSSLPTVSSNPTLTANPSATPSVSSNPTLTLNPSAVPSVSPIPTLTLTPSALPSTMPSTNPTLTLNPSAIPSVSTNPTLTLNPSALPSEMPSTSRLPSNLPSITIEPSASPTESPSEIPSRTPVKTPTSSPIRPATLSRSERSGKSTKSASSTKSESSTKSGKSTKSNSGSNSSSTSSSSSDDNPAATSTIGDSSSDNNMAAPSTSNGSRSDDASSLTMRGFARAFPQMPDRYGSDGRSYNPNSGSSLQSVLSPNNAGSNDMTVTLQFRDTFQLKLCDDNSNFRCRSSDTSSITTWELHKPEDIRGIAAIAFLRNTATGHFLTEEDMEVKVVSSLPKPWLIELGQKEGKIVAVLHPGKSTEIICVFYTVEEQSFTFMEPTKILFGGTDFSSVDNNCLIAWEDADPTILPSLDGSSALMPYRNTMMATFQFKDGLKLKICDNTEDNADLLCAHNDGRSITVWELDKPEDVGGLTARTFLKNSDTGDFLTVESQEIKIVSSLPKPWIIELGEKAGDVVAVLHPGISSKILCADYNTRDEFFTLEEPVKIMLGGTDFSTVNERCLIDWENALV